MRRTRLASVAAAMLLVPLVQVLPASAVGAEAALAAPTPPVGTVRPWLGMDNAVGSLYRKDYTLRGVGNNIEVWVANNRAFPAGDCRAQVPGSTEVTDAQVNALISEFDNNVYPKETATFSTPPDRDGSNAQLDGDFTGDGNKTVALIDNVRDDNFYSFPQAPNYTTGFFSAEMNEVLDRNVITLDAFDWAHRSGANPADAPTGDLCTSRPAKPRLYEGMLAGEWQQLLMHYTDPREENWINEGLADFAKALVGYVNPRLTVFDRGGDRNLYCYQGFGPVQTPFNTDPQDCGGPENSLNLWSEGNPATEPADHGHAHSLMQFLYDRYGADFMTRLHNDGERQGLASLDAALEAEGVPNMYQVLHDHQSMVLLDKIVGEGRGTMLGVQKGRVTSPSLRSTVNLANPQSNDDPGVAPNGADYVQLQQANGTPLRGRDLRSLNFQGAATLPPFPLEWTTVSDDPDSPGDPVLFSGNGNNLNATAVAEVAVPAADPTLRFDAKYGAEFGFDYGYVVVSTDGGETYQPIAGDKTVDGPLGPSLNGTTNGFERHTYDLSAYADQTVLLGLRYVSDGGVNEGGLLVDDLTVGSTLVSDGASLEPFDSPTEVNPTEVNNWNLKVVAFDERNQIALQREFNGKSSVRLGTLQLIPYMLFPKVVVTVAYDEPTELLRQHAPYTLTVNGVAQPGGGG